MIRGVQNTFKSIVVWLLLTVLFLIPFARFTQATDAECEDIYYEESQTKCQSYFDEATGSVIPDAEYLKCFDEVTCDPDPNPDPDAEPKVSKRCCVVVPPGTLGQGKYGGKCLDPGSVDRNTLGSDAGATTFIDLKPTNCNVDEASLSPGGAEVWLIPPDTEGNPQPLETYVASTRRIPQVGISVADIPVFEDVITVYNWQQIAQKWTSKSVSWFYQEDNGFRRYFLVPTNNLFWHGDGYLKKDLGLRLDRQPTDPRPRLERGLLGLGNIGCAIGNAFKKPMYSGLGALMGMATNNDNLPDISLLCTQGVPQFDDSSEITIDETGGITGFDAANCHCVDENAGPGTAAVLLCTRFIAGMNDANVPWRDIIPVPDVNGIGSNKYNGLLFGQIENTSSIDEFQNGVSNTTKEFFESDDDVPTWIAQLIKVPSNILKTRFFGNEPWPRTVNEVNQDQFKLNSFVRQYIGCLSCAKYGGFPTALGCLPANKVDRFLSEGVLGLGIGIAGAVSVLCIIYGAIQFQLSAGEAAKVQKAQKLITQCILGLLLILFSVFLLRFVGVNLLRIYGLG